MVICFALQLLGWQLVFGATVVALGGILIAIYLSRH